jgi:heme/copper-type cytochrome/quinol oxidase subunit 2
MSEFWLVFWWTGPIGVGIFLVCLGAMIYLIAKADAVSKRTKAMQKDMEYAPRHEALP